MKIETAAYATEYKIITPSDRLTRFSAVALCAHCRIPTTLPATLTVGGHQPLNNFGDLLREEISRAGYTEMLTHGLCSRDENFKVRGGVNSKNVHTSAVFFFQVWALTSGEDNSRPRHLVRTKSRRRWKLLMSAFI